MGVQIPGICVLCAVSMCAILQSLNHAIIIANIIRIIKSAIHNYKIVCTVSADVRLCSASSSNEKWDSVVPLA